MISFKEFLTEENFSYFKLTTTFDIEKDNAAMREYVSRLDEEAKNFFYKILENPIYWNYSEDDCLSLFDPDMCSIEEGEHNTARIIYSCLYFNPKSDLKNIVIFYSNTGDLYYGSMNHNHDLIIECNCLGNIRRTAYYKSHITQFHLINHRNDYEEILKNKKDQESKYGTDLEDI